MTTKQIQYVGSKRELHGARVVSRRYRGAGRFSAIVEHHGREYALADVRAASMVRREVEAETRTTEQIAGELLAALHSA